MNKTSVILLTMFAFVVHCAVPSPAIASESHALYVSPSGNDANPGSLDRPFATLARVRDAIRSRKQDGQVIPDVILRGGVYYLPAPVVFDASDAGQQDAPVVYRNYEGEVPVLAGGIPVTGWTPYRDRIVQAALPEDANTAAGSLQVIENGVPGTLARTPNEGWFRLLDPKIEPFWSFGYDARDFDPAGTDTAALYVHLIQMGTYFSEHIPVKRVDPVEQRFFTEFKMRDPAYDPVAGKTYLIENALSLLDAPGEYYADTASHTLYYWPFSEAPDETVIIADSTPALLELRGTGADNPVHDLVFQGIQFEGGYNQIACTNAARVVLRDCRLLNAGNTAVSIDGASTDVTVSGCEIASCGRDGIAIHGEYERPESGPATVRNRHHTIQNNYIHHVGRKTITGCGISMFWSANDNVIEHNLITDAPKSGVIMFSMWDMPRELGIMNNNIIRNNDLARCVTSSWDGGAFYIGATTESNTFENNRVSDVWSWFNATWPQPEDRPEDTCPFDFDPGMTYTTRLRNNVCFGANATTLEFGRYTDETFLENNYFESPDRPGEMLVNGRWEKNAEFIPNSVADDFGLTPDFKFPYPREVSRPFSLPIRAGFDGTLSPFYLYRYADGLRHEYLASGEGHEGNAALRMDKDVVVARYRHPAPIAARVSVWFYDDATKRQATCLALLRGPAAIEEGVVALGVDAAVSSDHYVIQAWGDRVLPTPIARTTGWHELMFDVQAGKEHGAELTIDGQTVGRIPMFQAFSILDLGDARFGTDSRGMRFDTVSIE